MPRLGKDTFVRVRLLGGEGSYILAPVLTSTQRNALTGAAGMLIYNSTTGQLENYNGSSWVAVGKVYGDATFLPLVGGTLTGLVSLAGSGGVVTRSKVITGTRVLNAAGEDVAYTGVGFKPSSISAFAGVANTVYASSGFAGSDKAGNSISAFASGFWFARGAYLLDVGSGGTTSNRCIVKSYDADGFTLTWELVGAGLAATANLQFLCRE